MRHNPFAQLPIVIRKKQNRVVWRVLQLLVLAIAGLVIASSRARIDDEPMLVAAGLGVGLCLILEILMRLRGRFAKVTVTIDQAAVQGSSGKEQWREPLGAYEGVLWREVYRQTSRAGEAGLGRTQRTAVLELKHGSVPARTVRLLEQKSRDGVRACWEATAGTLGLVALRELSDGAVIRRQPADLNKSLRELVRERRQEVAPRGSLAVPDSVEWNTTNPLQARVRMPEAFLQFIFFGSLILPLAAIMAAIGVGTLVPLILVPAPLATYVYWKQSCFQVGLVQGELRIAAKVGRFAVRNWRVPVDEVEQVWTAPMVLRFVHHELLTVTVESDHQTVSLHPLSPPAGAWLSWFIQTVVVDAPASD